MKFGEFLLDKDIITPEQLNEALTIQVDNPSLKLGEVLVAHQLIGNNELLTYIRQFMDETGAHVKEVTEWLNQDEADELIRALKGTG